VRLRVLKPGGRLAVSDIALKDELPVNVAQSMAAYVGCIAGAIRIEDYRQGLLAAGFEHVQLVDSGADLNAYKKVDNQSGCCSPAMAGTEAASCCSSDATTSAPLHEDLTKLLSEYDVNSAAASVKVYAVKPAAPDKNAVARPAAHKSAAERRCKCQHTTTSCFYVREIQLARSWLKRS